MGKEIISNLFETSIDNKNKKNGLDIVDSNNFFIFCFEKNGNELTVNELFHFLFLKSISCRVLLCG